MPKAQRYKRPHVLRIKGYSFSITSLVIVSAALMLPLPTSAPAERLDLNQDRKNFWERASQEVSLHK